MQNSEIHPDIESVIWDADRIQERVNELGLELAVAYASKAPLVLVTLTGAFAFAADLVRNMSPVPLGLQVDFVRASSYGAGTTSSGDVKIQDFSRIGCRDRHVVLVEDIVDTGRTLQRLVSKIYDMGASSVATVALLNKKARRVTKVSVSYVGFECPDKFIVGYGLDYNEFYRSLPYIGVLKASAIQE